MSKTNVGHIGYVPGSHPATVTISCSGATLQAGDKLVVEAEKVGTGGTWTNGGGFVKFRYV